jgi:selenocysteine-specific elongation factor
VLSLLGLRRGAVALTKTDRVDAARIDEVRAQVASLVIDTPLADSPLIALSAATGEGVEALRELLFDVARETHGVPVANHAFRLAIDRVFSLAGVGTVVTGTVHAGKVKVGDELTLVPSTDKLRARVRSLHAQNQNVDEARAGQRCALVLVGIANDHIHRGQWIVESAAFSETQRFDATLDAWRGESKALRSGTAVHVHVGAKEVMGTVTVLLVDAAPADSVAPGNSAVVQIVLREPIARGEATASCCATHRPAERSQVARCSILLRRRAIGEHRNEPRNSTRGRMPTRRLVCISSSRPRRSAYR